MLFERNLYPFCLFKSTDIYYLYLFGFISAFCTLQASFAFTFPLILFVQ